MKAKMILFSSVMMALISCGASNSRGEKKVEPEAVQIQVPVFDADSAYQYVKMQTDLGPRVPGTSVHQKAATLLEAELKRHGAQTLVQEFMAKSFDNQLLKGYNIVGSYQPEIKSRILLFAHWDTRPFSDTDPDKMMHRKPLDGANDGASGVGVLLEVARQLQVSNPKLGVDILFFDLEDYGAPYFASEEQSEGVSYCLGSQYWAKTPHVPGYSARYGILLDMVGDKNAKFTRDLISVRYAPSVVDKVWSAAQKLGYGNYFVNENGSYLTDDHIYVNQYGIPSIDIVDYDSNREKGFADSWHTQSDNISNIDPATLKAVGQTLLEVIYKER
ncbi:MAG: M28 family peptidase [Bacteroidales bacterium]